MKLRYTGISDPLCLLHGKVYEVIGQNTNLYQVIDETGEDYLYPKRLFVGLDDELPEDPFGYPFVVVDSDDPAIDKDHVLVSLSKSVAPGGDQPYGDSSKI